jgi:chromate transporter
MTATNLLPGPNSTQMTMHVGYVQRGAAGVWAAGSAFILPAALITLALSWAYVELRELPAMDAVFYGVQPVELVVLALGALAGVVLYRWQPWRWLAGGGTAASPCCPGSPRPPTRSPPARSCPSSGGCSSSSG